MIAPRNEILAIEMEPDVRTGFLKSAPTTLMLVAVARD